MVCTRYSQCLTSSAISTPQRNFLITSVSRETRKANYFCRCQVLVSRRYNTYEYMKRKIVDPIRGANINQKAVIPPKNPPRNAKAPDIINSTAPIRWVSSQTVSLESVQGVRMPMKKLRLACRIMKPIKMKSNPSAGNMALLILKLVYPRFQASVSP